MGGSSSSSSAATTNTTKKTTNISSGLAVDIADNVTNIVGSKNVKVTDHGAVEKAVELSMAAIKANSDNTGGVLDLYDSALDNVNIQAERNYDFAEKVSIPLNAQATEDFMKWSLAATVAVSIAMIYGRK